MFTLIIGPMKSGKSLELLSRAAPYEYANQTVRYVTPNKNVRDEGIWSRMGLVTEAQKVSSFTEIDDNFDIIAVDEIHMFNAVEANRVWSWLMQGKNVIISGLDLDYKADVPPIIERLYQFKPDEIVIKKAVCDNCKVYDAQYTRILKDGRMIKDGLPTIVPDDGTYEYQARCRKCL